MCCPLRLPIVAGQRGSSQVSFRERLRMHVAGGFAFATNTHPRLVDPIAGSAYDERNLASCPVRTLATCATWNRRRLAIGRAEPNSGFMWLRSHTDHPVRGFP